jgi:16S rRNA (guanine527-N7)-methyltransferase
VNPHLEASLAFAGVSLDETQTGQLVDLGDWLKAEAVPAGALGPAESARIQDRHLADSIVYAAPWKLPPAACWDLGSGVGLPGLVLAVIWPGSRITLIDRSSRRIDLARRAARVIGAEVETIVASVSELDGAVEAIVSRAAIPADVLLPHIHRLLAPGGLAVVSGSGVHVPGYDEFLVPPGILDHSPRLLMMRAK